MEISDWMKTDINHLVSTTEKGIQDSNYNVENHVYNTLKKHDIKSGLYDQLNYNYHYRAKQALQDHDLYDPVPLKAKFTELHDTWHVSQQIAIDETSDVQYVSTPTNDSAQLTMYEHPEIKQKVNTLKTIITDHSKKQKDQQDAIHLEIPKWPALRPFGFNYPDVKQNSEEWSKLRIGKVPCSSVESLIGLSGNKEHLYILTCITNDIDPAKAKPKKYRSFARGQEFENEAREAFEANTGIPVSTCGYFTHPTDKKYGGSPDSIRPAYLLEIKTRIAGSKEPLNSITADHLLQTNFQMSLTGANITFLQSYLPETKCSNVFLIEKNNLHLDVVKMVVDKMITNTIITSWNYEEDNLLRKTGEHNLNKVLSFESLKPLRAWLKKRLPK